MRCNLFLKKEGRKLYHILLLLLVLSLAAGQSLTAQNLARPNVDGYAGLQVNSFTGNLFYQRTDLVLPAKGLPLDVTFSYNSSDRDKNYGYGYGWTFTYNQYYEIGTNGSTTFYKPDGRKDVYPLLAIGFYSKPKGIFDELSSYAPGKFVLRTKEGIQYFFDDPSHRKLTRIRDRNGNEIVLTYTGSNLNTVTDASGHVLRFQWSAGRMTKMTAEAGGASRSYTYAYNSGYLTSVTDPAQNTTSYEYGIYKTMSLLTDGNGNKTVIEYNDHIAVKSLIACQGQKSFIYNGEQGQVYVIEGGDGKSVRTTYYFDGSGRLASREGNCCGYKTTYGYDANNNITTITDARGSTSTYGYDGKGNLLSETDPLGRTVFYTYEPTFNGVKTVKDKKGRVTALDYDASGNLTKITDPFLKTLQYAYNSDGTLKSTTDKKGRQTAYTYDVAGYVSTVTDRGPGVTSVVHDAWGNTLAVTDAEHRTTQYQYDSINHPVKQINAYGLTYREYTYDRNGNRIKVNDANGYLTTFSYDGNNKLTGYKDAAGNIAYIEYDVLGNMVAKTDVLGHKTQYGYNDLNQLTEVTNPEGERTQYSYDAAGNRTRVVYPNGNAVAAEYDKLNRLVKASDNIGAIAEYSYDENGNKVQEQDAVGNTVNYKYDALNRLTTKYDALGNYWSYGYDDNDNLVTELDRRGKQTTYAYDSLDRMVSMVDAAGGLTRYAYDKTGNRTSVTDPNGNTTAYRFDLLKRDSIERFADGSTKAYTYDPEGNLRTRRDNSGIVTTYNYDELNRSVVRIYPSGIDSFGYYSNGLMRMAKSSAATVLFTYDRADRIKSETLNGKATAYAYNIAAGVKTITYPGGRIIQRNFNGRNHLKAIFENGKELAGFDYNAAGQMTAKRFGNGTSAAFTYNGNGQLSDLTYNPAGFTSIGYTYNKEGSPTAAQFNHRPQSSEAYTTDALNQLKTFTKGTQQSVFNYDGTGNRTSAQINGVTATYAVNSMNAYTSIVYGGSVSPAYDGNGNTTNDGHNTYSYDEENRITKVNSGATAVYSYDALGRRIQKNVGGAIVNYYFDGQQVIEERNTGDNTTATYVWGTWIDDIVSTDRANSTYYYHTNNIGSVVAITNVSGAVVERYEYDAFGKRSIFNSSYNPIAASIIGNTYSFTGRQFDSETGLYYYRTRYYDVEHGRFLQRDPFGYIEGLGLYAYVRNMPSSKLDPWGTESIGFCCKGPNYHNQYGKSAITLDQFKKDYANKTEDQIVIGKSSFLGYEFPNNISGKGQFITLPNGSELDMVHFMVVGRRGKFLGYMNETKQIFTSYQSAFYSQDLYSNRLGVNFFERYGDSIDKNPQDISDYIYEFLSDPANICEEIPPYEKPMEFEPYLGP